MGIVGLALRRPYTFVVMAVLILILGIASIKKTPTDIFPNIDIPVISVIWSYKGLTTDEMAKRITTYSEYSISANASNIKNIESQTLNGVSIIKVYFQPDVHIDAAVAQVDSISQAIRAFMPPGMQPPIIVQYSASSVPVVQIGLSSTTMSEAQVFDYGLYNIRQQLAVVQGTTLPAPYGGKQRQIMVDIDPQALQAKGLSPTDVTNAINAQNLTLPTGEARIGKQAYPVSLNSSPETIDAFNNIPIKQVNGAMIYIRDVAQVHDGFAVQTNIVRQNGSRGVLLTILKNGNASTLDIVERIKALMPQIRASAPKGMEISLMFDQSLFVRAAMEGVVRESLIAACLTAAMILLFLGSWRSMLIVAVSIPLSILSSICLLSALGETLNIMTLGGLALAVGMLVDDATVAIENIHRNREEGKSLQRAIIDGTQQITVPTFVATLTICIVFVSVVFLNGPARFLFVPLAEAVVFAMATSYILSRTLLPVMANALLRGESHEGPSENDGPFTRFYHLFNEWFEGLRAGYIGALDWALHHRRTVFAIFLLLLASGGALLPFVGRDFFPSVDAGQIRLHVRAPAGTRIEETEHRFTQVEDEIRRVIPARDLSLVLDNIGVGQSFNLAFGDSSTTGGADGEILVSLKEDHSRPTPEYAKELRRTLNEKFPDMTFFFQPADMVSQILNFGLAAPIDIRVQGYNQQDNYRIAREIEARVARIPGAADVHIHQVTNVPGLHLTVDRTRAAELGLTQQDVANNVLVSLSGTAAVAPNFWADPMTGVTYPVVAQTPMHRLDSTDAITSTGISASGLETPQLLSNLATLERQTAPEAISHSNVQPVFDIYANVQDRDLGGVASEIDKIVAEYQKQMQPGNTILVRGQIESMNQAFVGLGIGLVFAAALVYLLMVVNFQSWLDPFIILTALPGGLVGIVWMLFVTRTTFNVPSLMGAIMSVGVATANSILLVTFANEQRKTGMNAIEAALEAGRARLRPVMMTALAMIIGMLPMALGLGEGGEQNAPLGRAVIGGLIVATTATLMFVPVVYSLLRRRQPLDIVLEEESH